MLPARALLLGAQSALALRACVGAERVLKSPDCVDEHEWKGQAIMATFQASTTPPADDQCSAYQAAAVADMWDNRNRALRLRLQYHHRHRLLRPGPAYHRPTGPAYHRPGVSPARRITRAPGWRGWTAYTVLSGSSLHILATGSWQNCAAKPKREPGASAVTIIVQMSANCVEISLFTTAGTYH